MNKKRYIIAWEEKYPTLTVDLFARATVEHTNIISNDIAEYLSFIENIERVIAFYSEEAHEKIKKEHGSYFLNKKNIHKMISAYDKIIAEHKKFLQEFQKINLLSFNDGKLLKLWNKFSNLFVKMAAYFRATRPELEMGPVKLMKKILATCYPQKEIEQKLTILATSPRLTLVQRERNDWAKTLKTKIKDKNKLKNLLLGHIQKYPSFFNNIYKIDKILNLLEKRFSQDKKIINEIEQGIKKRKKFLQKLPTRQKEIIKRCQHNKDLIDFSRMLQEFGWYRFELKDLWVGLEIRFLPLFEQICKRSSVSLLTLFNYYTLSEITKLLEEKKKLDRQEIAKRKKCLAIIVKNKNYKLISGDEALRLLKKTRNNLIIEEQIKGNTAYPGLVRGRARIILPKGTGKFSVSAQKNFKKGDILVTSNTQPAMVPLMAKAGAIVTDIGGVTSHSAIVSRELKIPCIIGTKTATQVLKDGDLVEVDANKGIVKIIK